MILKDGTDTNDYKRPGKYCDPMAVVLDSRYMQGDDGDSTVSIDQGSSFSRYGRRVIEWDSQGFIGSLRFAAVEGAKVFMSDLEAEWYEGDDSQ